MSLDPQSAQPSNDPDLQTIAAKLDGLEGAVAAAVRSARSRNRATFILGILAVLLTGFWLGYAHQRFTSEITPDLMASLGQSYLETNLPSATQQLETSLKEKAPSVMDEGETRLRALPIRLDDQFRNTARVQMQARMPDLQERLYQSLKAGIADSKAQIKKAPGDDEGARFRLMADSLAGLYRTDAMKFTDDLYSQYRTGSGDIVNGLTMLAEDKNLTPEQKTQRNLVRDFLILAHDSAPPEPRKLPDAN